MVALILGTLISGMAAAYATSTQHLSASIDKPMPPRR
jgi:hypothetical protein